MTDAHEGPAIPAAGTRFSRRTFVYGLGLAVAGGLAPVGLCRTLATAAQGSMPLNQATFAALHGEVFQVEAAPSQWVEVTLLRVVDHGRYTARRRGRAVAAGRCFAVVFRGSHQRPLAEGTYTFVHERTGAFALFIVPGAADAHGPHYEALFNHLAA